MIALGNSTFLSTTSKVMAVLNPDVVYVNDDMVVSWRHTPGVFRVVWIKRSSISKNSGVSSSSSSSSSSSIDIERDVAYLKTIDFTSPSLPMIEMKGEDPRIFVTSSSLSASLPLPSSSSPQRLWVVFCKRYPKRTPGNLLPLLRLLLLILILPLLLLRLSEIQMSYAQIFFNNHSIYTDDTIDINFQHEAPREDQKNWTPFEYQDRLIFISSHGPSFRVVESIQRYNYH